MEAQESGIEVQGFHTDNGVFTSKEFMKHLLERKQTIKVSGAGAAHQNGVAERAICTITTMARTLLIHAAMRSPDKNITADLWPMAMDHASWMYNHLPRADTGLSPNDMWTKSQYEPVKQVLGRCHVWGCPAFVLEPKLQKSGINIPK